VFAAPLNALDLMGGAVRVSAGANFPIVSGRDASRVLSSPYYLRKLIRTADYFRVTYSRLSSWPPGRNHRRHGGVAEGEGVAGGGASAWHRARWE